MRPWLLLGLLLTSTPSPAQDATPVEGQTVTSVRLEGAGAQEATLTSYLDIQPGRPLTLAAVRRAIERLNAAGPFADVIAEVERGPEGVALTFRLRPAPRLRGVLVDGDRVLSPDQVLDITRLAPGEPLWAPRLDRAARDVAVRLSEQGYLEAQASAAVRDGPDGARAVFTLTAGRRVGVSSVRIQGLNPVESARLGRQASGLMGAPYRRAEAEKAAEALRKQLVQEGRWRATVDLQRTYDPQSASVALTYLVQAGRPWTLDLRGSPDVAGLRPRIEDLLREGGAKEDVLEEAQELIEERLRGLGHRTAAAPHREETRGGRDVAIFEVQPGPLAQIASVAITGAEGLGGVPTSRPGMPLDDRQLEEDARALTLALEARGHASAHTEVEAAEGGGLIAVTFRTEPGPGTLVAGLKIEGPPLSPSDSPLRPLRCREGQPYRARDVALDRDALRAAYRDGGHLQAEVVPEVVFSEERSRASITLRVTAGPRTTVARVIVTGLDRTREEVVRRELVLREGEALGPSKVLESQRRLGALGIFRRVVISELDPESVESRSLVVQAEEAPLTGVAYGLGYAERDLLRASAEVTRRNLGGLDRSLSAFVRASFGGSRVLATYREPYLFGRKQELLATAFREEEDRDTFDFRRYGGLLQMARSLSPRTSLILRYSYQRTRVFNINVPLDEVDRQFRSVTVSGPSASLIDDTRDDPLDPRRGHFLGADVQLSLKDLGGASLAKAYLQGASYRRLWPIVTLAVDARLGLGATFGQGVPLRLPLPDRFFAGGDYSLRGFQLDTAGPMELAPATEQAPSGVLVPTGGNALILAGAELRIDLGRFLSLAVFSDMGNVFRLASDVDLGGLRYTAGLGLRYRTALGPVRLDWGYKLNRQPGESAGHLHFTIGHAF